WRPRYRADPRGDRASGRHDVDAGVAGRGRELEDVVEVPGPGQDPVGERGLGRGEPDAGAEDGTLGPSPVGEHELDGRSDLGPGGAGEGDAEGVEDGQPGVVDGRARQIGKPGPGQVLD